MGLGGGGWEKSRKKVHGLEFWAPRKIRYGICAAEGREQRQVVLRLWWGWFVSFFFLFPFSSVVRLFLARLRRRWTMDDGGVKERGG